MDYKNLRPEVQNYMKSIQSTLEEENYLKNVDSASLDLLATNLNIIFDAKEILDKDGIVSYNNNGTPMPHPAVKIMNDAQRKALEITVSKAIKQPSLSILLFPFLLFYIYII